jgi:serine/threonine protein kinase
MQVSNSPPKAPPVKYAAHMGTRWQKELEAAGGLGAFEHPDDPKFIGPWIIGECVGKGASGRVKIAKHKRTGQLAAVKILPLQPLVNSRASLATQQAKSHKQRLGIDREITMMKLMDHPNIMRIYDVYEGGKELYLVLEYVEGGELFDFLVNRGRLHPLEALAYFKQLVYGLNYAHTFSIIHRDLKPENILIHSLNPPLIKIADWGMAAFAPPALQLETSCGSPHYASPEIVNGEKYEGNATDIWSCGVILYALLTGRLPFDDKNVRTLLEKVKAGKYDMPPYIDPQARDLLSRMLIVDVAKRMTVRPSFPSLSSFLPLSHLLRFLKYFPTPGYPYQLPVRPQHSPHPQPALPAPCAPRPISTWTSSNPSALSGADMQMCLQSRLSCWRHLGRVHSQRRFIFCWSGTAREWRGVMWRMWETNGVKVCLMEDF